RDGNQHVVGHRPVGTLDHQVEHPIVRPQLGGIVERDESEEHPEAHQRESRRETQHDHDHNERQHQESKRRVAHLFKSPPIPRWRAVSSISCARSMAILRDSSSTYSLCASCSSTTSISATSCSRLGHSPVFRQTTQRTISATPCSITSAPAKGIIALK